jgi:hypothetical protein
MKRIPRIEKADFPRSRHQKGYLKKLKNRSERKRAKRNPLCVAAYGRFKGWQS